MGARRVLVTGGTGLVGCGIQHVVNGDPQYADDVWIFISSKDADLTSYTSTKSLFDAYRPTHVIHLAAKVGGLFHNMADNLGFLRDNMAINDNVLRCADEARVEKCISCLSTCIFPDKTSYPINETMVHNGPPHESNFGYSHAKRMLDVYNKAYRQKHTSNGQHSLFTAVIPCNVFGPHDNYHLKNAHVLPALMHKMYLAEREGRASMLVMGSGRPLRQFIYSRDLARLFLLVLDKYDSVEPIILSVGEEISIADAARGVKDAIGYKGELIFGDASDDGQLKKTACNDKLLHLFPDFRFTPFKEAINQSCQWLVQHFHDARK